MMEMFLFLRNARLAPKQDRLFTCVSTLVLFRENVTSLPVARNNIHVVRAGAGHLVPSKLAFM